MSINAATHNVFTFFIYNFNPGRFKIIIKYFRSALSIALEVFLKYMPVLPLFDFDGVKKDLYPSIEILHLQFSFSFPEVSGKLITSKSFGTLDKN